jgi:hypothetical protein
MNCQELIQVMAEKGYWTTPGGKTPHATLAKACAQGITIERATLELVVGARSESSAEIIQSATTQRQVPKSCPSSPRIKSFDLAIDRPTVEDLVRVRRAELHTQMKRHLQILASSRLQFTCELGNNPLTQDLQPGVGYNHWRSPWLERKARCVRLHAAGPSSKMASRPQPGNACPWSRRNCANGLPKR